MLKQVEFVGRSRQDLQAFPPTVRHDVGNELFQVQLGGMPSSWKPMKSIGPGASEIRIQDESGAYRVIYVAKFEEAIYVLHCFEKKTQKTSRADIELAAARYKSLLAGRLRHPRTV